MTHQTQINMAASRNPIHKWHKSSLEIIHFLYVYVYVYIYISLSLSLSHKLSTGDFYSPLWNFRGRAFRDHLRSSRHFLGRSESIDVHGPRGAMGRSLAFHTMEEIKFIDLVENDYR